MRATGRDLLNWFNSLALCTRIESPEIPLVLNFSEYKLLENQVRANFTQFTEVGIESI